ncbi:MAG: hypothetical protein ACYC5G_04340 [Candidatus Doudnabacteria bacterium]
MKNENQKQPDTVSNSATVAGYMPDAFITKADGITDNIQINDAVIKIGGKLPKFESLEKAKNHYYDDAVTLYEVIKNYLPQGTRHQLLIIMLQDATNLYRGI